MKKLVFVFVIFCFVQSICGQGSPLTQKEYVNMLYALQKEPGGKPDIIEALRKRGIDFVVTDGLRDLTRSKGANDEELKRALEEAGRRKENPIAAKPPPHPTGTNLCLSHAVHDVILDDEANASGGPSCYRQTEPCCRRWPA